MREKNNSNKLIDNENIESKKNVKIKKKLLDNKIENRN